ICPSRTAPGAAMVLAPCRAGESQYTPDKHSWERSRMGDAQTAELFRPLTLAGMTLKNRIVMSPMTRGRSPGGTPNELNVEYYAQRASAGLVFGEATAIADHGAGIMDSPGSFHDAQVDGWKRVTDEVHARGGHMGLQLFHCGHNLHPSLHPRGEVAFG